MSLRKIVVPLIFALLCSPVHALTGEVAGDQWWRPHASDMPTWQWQLNSGDIDTSFNVDIYDVDLFDTPQDKIDQLHTDGRKVICYFSAGSWEEWRDDAESFPESVLGNELDGWPGERWLDIRKLDIIGPLMQSRLDLAVQKRCDGVEPDNVDAYTNDSGFPLTPAHQESYNRWLASEAHARGLSIGLKNDIEQVALLVEDFDWALNEQCFQYHECDAYAAFISADKPVFGVEYQGDPDLFCIEANDRCFSWLRKEMELDEWRMGCERYLPPLRTDFDSDNDVDGKDMVLFLQQEGCAGIGRLAAEFSHSVPDQAI